MCNNYSKLEILYSKLIFHRFSLNYLFLKLYFNTSSVFFLLIATSVGYFISSDADGSGIPEVKTVISGISIYRYFSVEAFVAKVIGLFAALIGGIL